MSRKTLLLLGGTGPIGVHLTKSLKTLPDSTVYVTSRKFYKSYDNIVYIRGNAKDLNFVKETMTDIIKDNGSIDVVVDFMVWSNADFKKFTGIVLPNTKKYVYLSSSRIFADTKGELINEDSPKWLDVTKDNKFLETDDYAIPKAQQEDILKKSSFNNYLIIRPYITYAENRLPLGNLEKEIWLYRALHGRTIVISEEVCKHYTSLMYGKDVADAICSLVINDNNAGDSVNITSNEYLKWSDVLKIYTESLKKYYPSLKIKIIPYSLKAQRNDYQTIYDRMVDRRFDSTKLEKYVDASKFTSMQAGLTKCLDDNIMTFNYNKALQNWRFQAELDRITHEFAKRDEFESSKQFVKYVVLRTFPKVISNLYRTIKRHIL